MIKDNLETFASALITELERAISILDKEIENEQNPVVANAFIVQRSTLRMVKHSISQAAKTASLSITIH